MAYLSDKERKEPIKRICRYYEFTSCADLSQGVKIRPLTENPEYKTATYLIAQDVASFTAWWINAVHKNLNGFSGMDTIKWEVI